MIVAKKKGKEAAVARGEWLNKTEREGERSCSIILHQHKHCHHDSYQCPTASLEDLVSMATIHGPEYWQEGEEGRGTAIFRES